MKERAFERLRFLATAALVAIAFLNLWQSNKALSYLRPRPQDNVVIWEDRLRGVRDALMKVKYPAGNVGFISVNAHGHARTADKDSDWVQARYVMIPWNLVQDSLEAPYVILDLSAKPDSTRLPAGFVEVYRSTDGLVLLRKTLLP